MAELTAGGRSASDHHLWNSWWTQQAVLSALVRRELQSRFGRHNIGFLWMIAEPLMLASVVTILHTLATHHSQNFGMGPYPFTAMAYCLLIVFRNCLGRSEAALQSSIPLLHHAQIKPMDVMIAKMSVDITGALSSLTILMAIGIVLGLADPPARPIFLFAGCAAIIVFSFGLGLCVAALSYRYDIVGRFVHPITYFSWPFSGAFFTVNFLPVWSRETITWIPTVSMFELARHGMFLQARDDYIYPVYILISCAVSLLLGLIAMRWVRRHINL